MKNKKIILSILSIIASCLFINGLSMELQETGEFKIKLQRGELLPASSEIVFNNNQKIPLEELTSEEQIEGNYYIENKLTSGEGKGYGLIGSKQIYPVVYFEIGIYYEENITEPSVTNESITGNTTVMSGSIVQENEGRGLFSSLIRKIIDFFSGGKSPTGLVTLKLEKTIQGELSYDNPYTYQLEEGQVAKIIKDSIRTDSIDLSESDINMEIKDGIVEITTNYLELEEGFGQDYLGETQKTIEIDLSKIEISTNQELTISIIYQEQNLGTIESTQETETTSGTVEPSVIIPEEKIILTKEEEKILIDKFQDITLQTTKAEKMNNRLIRAYKLGNYEIEYSYDLSTQKEILKKQMEKDRILWLKDIAKSIQESGDTPVVANEYLNEVSY